MLHFLLRSFLILSVCGTLCSGISPVEAQTSSNDGANDNSSASTTSSRSGGRNSGPISLDALIIEEKLQIPVFLTLDRHKPEFENLKMTKHFLDLIIKSVEKNPF